MVMAKNKYSIVMWHDVSIGYTIGFEMSTIATVVSV